LKVFIDKVRKFIEKYSEYEA